jgi:hypothetical protein
VCVPHDGTDAIGETSRGLRRARLPHPGGAMAVGGDGLREKLVRGGEGDAMEAAPTFVGDE